MVLGWYEWSWIRGSHLVRGVEKSRPRKVSVEGESKIVALDLTRIIFNQIVLSHTYHSCNQILVTTNE